MTKGLGQFRNDNELRGLIKSAVRASFDASKEPEIVILLDTPFSSESSDLVEVRLIFRTGPEELTPTEIAQLRRCLFNIFESNGDGRRPLLRLISRADYQEIESESD